MHLKFKKLTWDDNNEAEIGAFYASINIDDFGYVLTIVIGGNEREDHDLGFQSIEEAKICAEKVYREYVNQFIKDHFDATIIST